MPSDSPTATPSSSTSASPTTSTQPAAPFRTRARIVDAKGDAGLQAPGYADLVSILVESDGRDVRATIDVAATLPTTPVDGEVIGIGLDFYRNADADESDYQLFVDGGSDGWFAYLHTPTGFVEYPGSFRLGGARLVFQVPMESLGGLTATQASGFLDWTRSGAVVNSAASDQAPNSGRARNEP